MSIGTGTQCTSSYWPISLVDFLDKSKQRRTQNKGDSKEVASVKIYNSELRTLMKTNQTTYPNHKRAELPSAFRVSSQASSKLIGSIVMEQIPITAIITNKAAVLFGVTGSTSNFYSFLVEQSTYQPR